MMHFLITRPQPDAAPMAERLKEAGHQCTLSPLLKLSYRQPQGLTPGDAQGLIFTSRNALRALAEEAVLQQLTGLPVFLVGPKLTAYAKQLGFRNIRYNAENAEELCHHIIDKCQPEDGILHYLTGTHLAFDMEKLLSESGFKIERTILYSADPVDDFTPEAIANIQSGSIHAVILLSPRTARRYAELILKDNLKANICQSTHYCLSQNVADELQPLGECMAEIAAAAHMDALFSMIERKKT